jgi:hypothetical protein
MPSDIHCRHWSYPFVGGQRVHTCAKSIDIREHVGGPDLGWGCRMPCIQGHFHRPAEAVPCELREPWTAEEIAASEAQIKEGFARFFAGRSPCCNAELIAQGTGRWCSKCKEFVARVCGLEHMEERGDG